ncbi:T9SS sorting signal type C domain-containing protein [Flavobacterium pallidum]|uniref:Secretion system C-terminal sorting domain-containing protein n=1 Tax=Flavobacterium pallidum TaxID=2172098 RepID=A0A2S1SIM8_9FLAO|nr:T9SS sorting signal type C domain-containing protein [Flavobacterium pallidum]AWI26273.1 hypothetical protein HYN49_10370 [Flavobacterium pallidum]
MGRIFTQLKKHGGFIALLFFIAVTEAHSQYTAIPDPAFEQFLIYNGHDNVIDGQVLTANISGITNLNVPGFAGITNLTGIRDFTALQILTCINGTLTSLDVSGLSHLNYLYCFSNQITTLNIAGTAIFDFYCYGNQLTSLNLHGIDPTASVVYAYDNPYLSCIETDNPAAASANPNWMKDAGAAFKLSCDPYFYIPDAAFEDALILNGIDDVADGKVLIASAEAATTLNMSFSSITDLTGINRFINLVSLDCSYNALTSLDVSGLTQLTSLNCSENQLQSLNVTGTALTSLSCLSNALTTLDITALTGLVTLDCSSNQLTAIHSNYNPNLSILFCNNNMLTEAGFNTGNFPGLTQAYVSGNQFGALDCSAMNSLSNLNCSSNQLTSLQAGPALQNLDCRNNLLTQLNLLNSDAMAMLNATGNAISCISIDDPAAATANTNFAVDAGTGFSTLCNVVMIPDANFEQYLITLGYDDVIDGTVQKSTIENITDLNVANGNITDLTGINSFINLNSFDCSNNLLTSLDVSQLTQLTSLNCNQNQLQTLHFAGAPLTSLSCADNMLTDLDISMLPGLTMLDCATNQIETINGAYNANLKNLFCGSNQLDDAGLGIANYPGLMFLTCFSNHLTTLDLSAMTDLAILNCATNQINSLQVGPSTAVLFCSGNQLTSLDLTNSDGIGMLYTAGNQLSCIAIDDPAAAQANPNFIEDSFTGYSVACEQISIPDPNFEQALINYGYDLTLDGMVYDANISNITELYLISQNISDLTGIDSFTSLQVLNCTDNQLTGFDFDIIHQLTDLQIDNNQLTSLNLSGSNLNAMSCFNNLLTCIQVDDVAAANNNPNWFKDSDVGYATDCNTMTLIPDPNFEQALIYLGYDTLINGQVPNSAISGITSLDVNNMGISDLTGIRDFTALTDLNCSNNNITSLDLNGLPSLTKIQAFYNQLSSINISGAPVEVLYILENQLTELDLSQVSTLRELYCGSNQLTSLDLSGQSQLTYLTCEQNQLATLDLSNTAIETLYCKDNALTNINLNGVTSLTGISCEDNQLTSLDLTNQANLTQMNCSNNHITSLDVSNKPMERLGCWNNGMTSLNLSGITTMTEFACNYNALTSLDVSAMTQLTYLDCSQNQLYSLDITGLPLNNFNAEGNNLYCIATDDPAAANDNSLWHKDNFANYAVSCETTSIPDANFEQVLIDLGIDNVIDGMVMTAAISGVTALDLSFKNVADLTGLEDFTALENFNGDSNTIVSFNFPTLTNLKRLELQLNHLTTLDLTLYPALEYADCHYNQLTQLTVNGLASLNYLNCGDNSLTSIGFDGDYSLQTLYCDHNALESLNIGTLGSLEMVSCGQNPLTELNLGEISGLTALHCQETLISIIYLSGQPNLSLLNLTDNPNLTCIEVGNVASANSQPNWFKDATATYKLSCAPATLIPDANFEQALIDFGYDDVIDGEVITGNISGINNLNVSNRNIASLEGLQDFTSLETFNGNNNALTTFDFPTLTALQYLHLRDNQLAQMDISVHTGLHKVEFFHNPLTSLTVGNLEDLEELNLMLCSLTTLDVSGCPSLHYLYCSQNPLASLNLGQIDSLRYLFVNSTELTALDLRHQPDLTNMTVTSTFGVSCITVDDVAQAASRPNWTKESWAVYALNCEPKTSIPDANFEQALIDLGYDDAIDGYVITSHISGITTLDVSNQGIADLTGIADFVSLLTLNISHNQLSSVGLSMLDALQTLDASYNNLSTLATDQMDSIQHVDLQHNVFTYLYLPGNTITYADLSHNQGQFAYFDNDALKYLKATNNQLIWALLALPAGEDIDLSENMIQSVEAIDIANFKNFNLSDNSLQYLILPPMPNLERLHVENNVLTKLNLRDKPLLTDMNTTGNDISCLLVNDVAAAEAQAGWIKDASSNYALLCDAGPYTLIPDPVFEQELVNMNSDEFVDGRVATANIAVIENLYLPERGVSDLTGIKDFAALTYLNVSYNNLVTLDLSGLSALEYLECDYNMLTSVDVSGLTGLEEMYCYGNQLKTLDVTGCDNLYELSCDENQLIAIGLNDNLMYLSCSYNQLTSLDLSALTQLESLVCHVNNLQGLDISHQPNLYDLECDENPMTCIKVADVDEAYNNSNYYKDEDTIYDLDCPGGGCTYAVWDGNHWIPSAPGNANQVVFMGDYEIASDFTACSLDVSENANVVVASGTNVNINGNITVSPSATLTFENNANLLQAETATNSGNVTITRDAMMRRLDYVYWSSPVNGQLLRSFSPATLDTRFYAIDEASNAFVWANPAHNAFLPAKGYMVRAPDNYLNFPAAAQLFTGIFTGVPNNGDIAIPITNYGQGYNLIGNPYPSPISADALLDAAPGTIYFWTHRTHGAESGANYASYNLLGGTAAETGGETPNGLIQTGQGFILQTDDAAMATFTNAMRVANTDGQFYRTAPTEQHRFWLNLSATQSGINQILIGYTQGATQGFDIGFDGKQIEGSNALSSRIGASDFVIQGRALPFDVNDIVPLSLKVATGGTYQIAIDHTDGLFAAGQHIYLKDNLTAAVHDLTASAYSFATDAGNFAERFAVVYTNAILGTNPVADDAAVVIYKDGNSIHINSGVDIMEHIRIFDVRGRLVYEKANINASDSVLSDFMSEKQVLLIQVTTAEGTLITKKYIY